MGFVKMVNDAISSVLIARSDDFQKHQSEGSDKRIASGTRVHWDTRVAGETTHHVGIATDDVAGKCKDNETPVVLDVYNYEAFKSDPTKYVCKPTMKLYGNSSTLNDKRIFVARDELPPKR